MNLLIGQHNARARRILDCEFRLAVFARDAADGAAEMLAAERFYVFDFEGLNVEVVLAHSHVSI